MSTDIIPAEVRTELVNEGSTAAAFVAAIAEHPCATQTDYDFLARLLLDVKARHREWEERRTSITRPILDAKRAADELFTPVLKPLKQVEGLIKDKLGAFTIAREEERRLSLAAGERPLAPVEQAKGVTVREVWDFDVVDFDAVPRDYLTIDAVLLSKMCCQKMPPPDVPGIRFFKRGQVIARAK